MKNNYLFLNNKNYEIENIEDITAIDEKLINIISILNKKGYHTLCESKARISKPYVIGCIINDLINKNLLDISSNEIIVDIIKKHDLESIVIIFDNNYKFNNLPNEFDYVSNSLICTLSCLKDNKLDFKTIDELNNELDRHLNDLEQWAKNIININN